MVTWKLRDYLDAHEVSAYALLKTTDLAPSTVYALARGDQRRVDLAVLDKVITGLGQLTGKQVKFDDLLEHEPEPEKMDGETRAWLESDLARLGEVEPYEWAKDEAGEGEALRYVPDKGWVSGG